MTLDAEPKSVGRYQVLERLGRGGMGVLYRGVDPVLDREVAIKVVGTEVLDEIGTDGRARFFREAKAAAKLQHRNIVTIFEYGDEEGIAYIVMEYLKGQTLAARMQKGPMDLDQKLDIMTEVCTGLEFAHRNGVVHRDVKPGSIWLSDDGNVKLLDFGIAHLGTATLNGRSDPLGTVAYMAPELITGTTVDGRADVFSASAVLFELLAGSRPFDAPSSTATMQQVLKAEPPSLGKLAPDVPPALVGIVMKGLCKDVDERYQSAADMAVELQSLRMVLRPMNETIVAPVPKPVPPSPRPVPAPPAKLTGPRVPFVAPPWLPWAGAAAVVLFLGGGLVAWRMSQSHPTITPPAGPAKSGTETVVKDVVLDVRSEPKDAVITLDGHESGRTPAQVHWQNSHAPRIEVFKKGYQRDGATPTEEDVKKGVLLFPLKRETATPEPAPAVAATPSQPSESRVHVVITAPPNSRYEFEVVDASSGAVIDGLKKDHELNLRPGQRIRLVNAAYFLNWLVPDISRSPISPPALGLLRVVLFPTTEYGRCPMYLDGQSFPLSPDGGAVAIPSGSHRVEAVCAQGKVFGDTIDVKAGSLVTPFVVK